MTSVVHQLATVLRTDPHQRVLHARGTWFEGSFVATRDAASLTRATLFEGGLHHVVGRFSGNRGGPASHDADTGDQGLAIRVGAAGDGMDLMMFTLPVFFVRTGEDLVAFLEAVTPATDGTPPDPARLVQFLAEHPEARAALSSVQPGVSAGYLGQSYHSVHSYGFDTDEAVSWVRLVLDPATRTPRLNAGAARVLPGDYLTSDLRAGEGAVFHLDALHPADGDAVHDPTAVWSGRRRTRLGTLSIDLVHAQPPASQPAFDPLHLPAGVRAPQDQLSRDRSEAYRAARCLRSTGA